MAETAGTKLRRARQTRQMSLEDAARATKIRAHQLADLEVDDYSNFANLAYARSYLVNYGKFLRVDTRPYVDGFSDASTFGLDDYQYLSAKPVGVYRVPHRRSSRVRRPQRWQLLGAALGMAALAVGVVGWVFMINVQRLGDLGTLAERQEAREKAAREGHASTATTDTASTNVANPAASAPVPVTGGDGTTTTPAVLPISAPAGAADGVSTPAPTSSPATVPTQTSIPALAATAVDPVATSPAPMGDDDHAVGEMLAAHASQTQTQKVVNDHPRGR